MPEQFHERGGIEAVGIEFVPELAASIDGGDGIDALALSARGNLGRSPEDPPGAV
jgi:hypothetical protein